MKKCNFAAKAIFCALVCALIAACTTFTIEKECETWRMTEIALESTVNYDDGGGDDILLEVVFKNRKDGKVIKRPAFWDGGKTFLVRFAPVSEGVWEWESKCENDKSLAGKSGLVRAVPYKGQLAIYRHGFVRTSPGKKYFVHADGTPFFYLGDTHWGMFREEIDEAGPHAGNIKTASHFKYIVDRRVEQGFTVYQSEPIDSKFNLRDGRVDASDIPGFRLADRYFSHIADAGLVHANAQFFFSSQMKKPLLDDQVALERISRYWVARFGAWPVMWTLAQEIDNDFYHWDHRTYTYTNNPWVAVAEYMHRNDAYSHPLSGHQENTHHTTITGAGTNPNDKKVTGNGVSVFRSEEVARITGHDWWAAQWSPNIIKRGDDAVARDYWASSRPAVNYEGRYCYLWTKDYGARAQGWISYLNGFFGYGYGAIDMWLYLSTYDINKKSHDGVDEISIADKAVHWSKAVEFPSAIQMGYMKNFFTSFKWWKMTPIFGGNNGDFKPETDSWHASKIADDLRTFIFYFNSRNKENLKTGTLLSARKNFTYHASWFDPIAGVWGKSFKLPVNDAGECALPFKPSEQDWVLVVKEISAVEFAQ